MNNSVRENQSGCYDPTAHLAMQSVAKSKREEERFKKLLGTIFYICGLAGFHVEGRITLIDEKTGRIWK